MLVYCNLFLFQTDIENKNQRVVGSLVMDLPTPPDGGWGWVICFASFMCNFILGK